MQIRIQSQGFTLTNAIREHAEQRLHLSLTRSSEHIRRVEMHLSDINGPRGGADKRCSILVELESMPDVVIEDIETDLYVAIDRAADRASQSVGRSIERKRGHATDPRPAVTPPETD